MTATQSRELLHDARFPGESKDYRLARDALLRAELDLRRQTEAVAAQRRTLPLGGEVPGDYAFEEWDSNVGAAREVRFSELFEGGRDTLFLYSFMFVPESQGLGFVGPCPSCTSIIDGIGGALPHVTQRINFAVAAKGPAERLHSHARSRGWRHARVLSSANNTYNVDYKAEDSAGNQWPLATVFVRRNGVVHHFWSSEAWMAPRDEGEGPRHVDFMWPLWAMLDRTLDGRGTEWQPELEYR